MADYNTLTLDQKISAALPQALKDYNVNNPATSLQDRDNLLKGIGALNSSVETLKSFGQQIGLFTPINLADYPELSIAITPYIPSGYTATTITLNEIINVAEGIKSQFDTMAKNISVGGAPIIATGNVAPVVTQPPTIKSPPTPGESITNVIAGAAALAAVANLLSNPDLSDTQTQSSAKGLEVGKNDARGQAAQEDQLNSALKGDWRVKLSLAPGARYLYKAEPDAGILAPLKKTDGIIFPYTPSISVTYSASYDSSAVQHSNYRIYQYQNSAVENISITCDFTAQSTQEANYLLAVIHFLRSVTKMFYGQDENPVRGTPPPLCYLTGLGQYQFNAHPLLISNFTYTLPNDVDYIRAVIPASFDTEGNSIGTTPKSDSSNIQDRRRNSSPTPTGTGGNPNPAALTPNGSPGSTQPTYVPTKIQIQITANPVVTRNDISNNFSVEKYATGSLLLGNQNGTFGGIW